MAESKSLGRNQSLVKDHNRRAVLLTLSSGALLSRIELARKTSLSATAITNIVADLLAQKIVRACPNQPSAQTRHVGRPRAELCLVKDARYVIGLQVRIGFYRIGLLNLLGELVDHREYEFPPDTPARPVILDMAKKVNGLIQAHSIPRKKIIGVGMGATGLVNHVTGVNVLSASFGWREVPVRDWLTEQLQLPVVVDNNVRCMALGEALFGAGRNVRSFAFVYGRLGIGAGIIVDGRVFRGSGLGAGEIGHTIVVPDNGPLCRCGQYGCLEAFVSEPALLRQAEALADEHPASQLAARLRAQADWRPIKRVFLAAREGDPFAQKLLATAGKYFGIALANLVNHLNPELILVGGLFAEDEGTLVPIAQAIMEEKAFAGLGRAVQLRATSFGWQAGIIGAGSLALDKFFYHSSEEI